MADISERIKKLRKSRRMTIKTFADRIGVSSNTVSRWEQRKNTPRETQQYNMCQVFDLPDDYFEGGHEKMPTAKTDRSSNAERSLGNRIKMLRAVNHLNQMAFCKHLGIHRQTLARWEANEGVPRPDKLQQIADMFDVSTIWLLYGDEPPKIRPATTAAVSPLKQSAPLPTGRHDELIARIGELSPTRKNRLSGFLTAMLGEQLGKNDE